MAKPQSCRAEDGLDHAPNGIIVELCGGADYAGVAHGNRSVPGHFRPHGSVPNWSGVIQQGQLARKPSPRRIGTALLKRGFNGMTMVAFVLYGAPLMSSTTLSPVKLQPPGAGLPTSELAYLRIVFRFACIVTSQNAAMRRFKLERDKIVSLARSVAVTQGNFCSFLSSRISTRHRVEDGRQRGLQRKGVFEGH
jgi:hypothetical protein